MITNSYFLNVLILILVLAHSNAQETCPCFVIKDQNKVVSIHKLSINNNESITINDSSIVSIAYSLNIGLNGDFITKEIRRLKKIISCKDNKLGITIVDKNGNEKKLPEMNLIQLRENNIRVNIKRGDGFKLSYTILGYDHFEFDKGPVLDMFGGKLPMKSDDYSITTETTLINKKTGLNGAISFQKVNGWLVANIKYENGGNGKFIIDLAATGSVIFSKYLPKDIQINKLEMVEYDGKNKKTEKGKMQGATGKIKSNQFIGKVTLKNLVIDELKIDQMNFNILNHVPSVFNEFGIIGILGNDFLQLSEGVKFVNRGDSGSIYLGRIIDTNNISKIDLESAGNLFFVNGKIQQKNIKFLFDTGAKDNIISNDLLKANDIEHSLTNSTKQLFGLDGKGINANVVLINDMKIGNSTFNDMKFNVANLKALESLGLDNNTVVLGMNFFEMFGIISIDFINKKLSLYENQK